MEDTVRLKLIEPHESNVLYRDALQTYKEIYNNSMAKGKGHLEPKFLGGNPIQLDTGNMNSLFKINGQELEYNDYYVSTKANGLRFMLLIGNKLIDGSRNIYLVSSAEFGSINFWTISQDTAGDLPPLPINLNVDKCLIDGELLFWGKIETRIVGKTIKEYKITKLGKHKPLIAFLAFDILYGFREPDYVRRKDVPIVSHEREFELGGSSAMIGPKALGRWPTSRRRHVLEEMFFNKDSPLWDYLHRQSPFGLNKVEIHEGNKSVEIRNPTHYGFTIFVSPFIKMNELFTINAKEIYPNMIKVLQKSIREQYYFVTQELRKEYLDIPAVPKVISHNIGKGYSTDGLILTPANEHYLIGPWTFCNNKQYKWKPANQLTIDLAVGEQISTRDDEEGKHYFYYGKVRESKELINFQYELDNTKYNAVIDSLTPFKEGTVVECIHTGSKQTDKEANYLFFDTQQVRYDKDVPNSRLAAISVLNAANIKKELNFLGVDNPSVLDLVFLLKNNKKLSKPQKEDVLVSLGQSKLLKCYAGRHPEILFKGLEDSILRLIEKKQDHENYELEVRIDFGAGNYNYSKCLIDSFLDSEYVPVPIVKVFDKSNNIDKSTRSVYVMLGDTADSLLLEETIEKVPRSEPVKVFTDIFNYQFNVVLSEEINTDEQIVHGSKNAGNSEYQNRYTITSLSDFWRVDIIEYGNAKNIEQAKNAWEQHPRTRVELEFAPASYLEDIIKWENQDVINMLLKQIDSNSEEISREVLLAKLQNYKNKLNRANPKTILKDLASVLIKLFNTFDMDLGNAREYAEREQRKEAREKEVREPKERKEPKESKEDAMKSRMKLFNKLLNEGNQDLLPNITETEDLMRELLRNGLINIYNYDDQLIEALQNIIKYQKEFELSPNVVKKYIEDLNYVKTKVKPSKKPVIKLEEKPKERVDMFDRLRAFHNAIKDELIEDVASNLNKPISLLDISVGQGGDLFKWHKADIEDVYGIDPNPESIKEARKRFQTLKESMVQKKDTSTRTYKFEVMKISDPDAIIPQKFDIVCCMFTLHYFFESTDMLNRVIEKVGNALKQGGYFIGTTMTRGPVKKFVLENPYPNEIQVSEIDDRSYRMSFSDPSMYSSNLPEYYVDFDLFQRICERNGLKLIATQKFSEIYKKFKKTNNKKFLMRPYEQALSELNTTYVFQKK